MISEGSCNTKDWSNDAENSALITGIFFFFQSILKYKTVILNCNISQYYCFFLFITAYYGLFCILLYITAFFLIYTVFWSNKCSLKHKNL